MAIQEILLYVVPATLLICGMLGQVSLVLWSLNRMGQKHRLTKARAIAGYVFIAMSALGLILSPNIKFTPSSTVSITLMAIGWSLTVLKDCDPDKGDKS